MSGVHKKRVSQKKQPWWKSIKAGSKVGGRKLWRHYTSQENSFTPLQIIKFEKEELGNDDTEEQALQVAKEHNIDLSKYKRGDATWYTFSKKVANTYCVSGSDVCDCDGVSSFKAPSDAIVLVCDGDDGYLILTAN